MVGRVGRRAAAVLAVCGALLLAACSQGSTGQAVGTGQTVDARPPVSLAAAAQEVSEAGSARFRMEMSGTALPVRIEVEGVADLAPDGDGAFTLRYSGQGVPADASVELRMVGGTLYLKGPAELTGAPDRWLSVDLAAVGGAGALDPSQSLAMLEAATDVVEAGPTQVAGVPATLYRGTIDLAQVVAGAQQQLPGLSGLGLGDLSGLGLGTAAFEAAVDHQGLLRRVEVTLDLDDLAGALGGPSSGIGTFTTVVEVVEVGVPVDVHAPDPATVVPADPHLPFLPLLGA